MDHDNCPMTLNSPVNIAYDPKQIATETKPILSGRGRSGLSQKKSPLKSSEWNLVFWVILPKIVCKTCDFGDFLITSQHLILGDFDFADRCFIT